MSTGLLVTLLEEQIGRSYDDQGRYVPSVRRCAPGLGWPLRGKPQGRIDPGHVQVMLQAQAASRMRRTSS